MSARAPLSSTVRRFVASQLSSSLGEALLSYTGPEPERVRTAIVALAKDDLERAKHFLSRAREDYRDVLWWAELDAKEHEQLAALGGMTVNERLSQLGLMAAFDAAVTRGDVDSLKQLLRRCQLSDVDVETVSSAALRRA
jgi:hypothetical protein